MNEIEKQVIKFQLDKEQAAINDLERQYKRALRDIEEKIKLLQSDELTQSRIYQIQYQKALRGQVEGILDKLHGDEYATIQQYLHDSYQDGFIGTMYSVHGQGIPLILPLDQNAAVKAVITDSQISEGLYNHLGVNIKQLKQAIRQEITRGLASNMPLADIARNIANRSKAPLSRAKTIVRTEGHRIQQASANDARQAAKAKGCDSVKQWNSTLDGDTRSTHRQLDGQIVELDEYFELNGKKARFPGDFKRPEEDCGCRCSALTRPKWDLDEFELDILKERAAYFGLDKTKDFEDFKAKYIKASQADTTTFWNLNGGKADTDYSVALSNRYEEGNETAKAVFSKYIPQGGAVADGAHTGKAHCQAGKVFMNYVDDAANVRGAGTTFFHEHGHVVDYKTGQVSHSDKYLKALEADMKALYASTGKRDKRDAEFSIMRMLTAQSVKNKVNGVSDIVYGLTKGKTGGMWYHDKKYYTGYAVQEEAFAHMFEVSFSAEKQALMKKCFPTAWQVFCELMEGIK